MLVCNKFYRFKQSASRIYSDWDSESGGVSNCINIEKGNLFYLLNVICPPNPSFRMNHGIEYGCKILTIYGIGYLDIHDDSILPELIT